MESTSNYIGWSDLKPSLHEQILETLKEKLQFDKVTKVQAAVIPLFLGNKDVCVKACTGSGKTLAFTIPLIQTLLNIQAAGETTYQNNEVVGLLLAPSRELAVQISEVVSMFSHLFESLNMCFLIGGNKLEYDLERIESQGANVVVATPGRLFDLAVHRQALSMRKLEVLIMDEADKLLEQGNEVHLNSLLQCLPKQRRTGLFSATMPSQLKNFIKIGMRNPFFVEVNLKHQEIFTKGNLSEFITVQDFEDANFDEKMKEVTELPSGLTNFYKTVDSQADKLPALMEFLAQSKGQRMIIFFATCASVDFHFVILQELLSKENIVMKLHGKINQKKRTKIYNTFKDRKIKSDSLNVNSLLLTTDLAARGIDIPGVDWIVQFDPPQWSDQFVHRIGRTARAGQKGQSLLFLTEDESTPYLAYLLNKKVEIWKHKPKVQTMPITAAGLKTQVQAAMLQDKDIVDKSQDAFVSFIRYYKEHQLSFIFSFNSLDIGQVANSYSLFRLPRVKEILGKKINNFIQNNEVNINEIPYKDANKGKQFEIVQKLRQEKFERKKLQNEIGRQEKIESDKRKNSSKSIRQRHKKEIDWQEWDDLADEMREIKRERKMKNKQPKKI